MESNNKGLGLPIILFIIFLTLKLAEVGVVSNWSWWWVTSPLWIPIVGVISISIIIIIVAIIFGISLTEVIEKAKNKNKSK